MGPRGACQSGAAASIAASSVAGRPVDADLARGTVAVAEPAASPAGQGGDEPGDTPVGHPDGEIVAAAAAAQAGDGRNACSRAHAAPRARGSTAR